MSNTTRVQIELPHASLQRLKALKDKTEAVSYAEVTKNAFRVYERLIQLQDSGEALLVRDKQGNVREIEIIL